MNGLVAGEGPVPNPGSEHLEKEDWVRDALEVGIVVEFAAELPPEIPGRGGIGNGPLANAGSGRCLCSAEIREESQSGRRWHRRQGLSCG